MSKSLALLGGKPVRSTPFTQRTTVDHEERRAVADVMQKGDLSLFFGSPGEFFLGGPKVREFESLWASMHGYRYAISVNSWTTGLMTAVGAAGVGPGDEVICPPTSMSATSTAILFYGGIPVFVDIEPDTFCLDPRKIEAAITPRTKAIMVVHLFGHPADMDAISEIATRHGLRVIEDAAHAPGAKYNGRHVGGMKDLGGFSFNYHKHIHTGEGGMIVTNDEDLAQRCRMIRNHGENVLEAAGVTDLTNMVGSNYRLTEIQAAIGVVQSGKLEACLQHRNRLHEYFSRALGGIDGLILPSIKQNATHSFYGWTMRFIEESIGIPRDLFFRAVMAELPKPDIWEQSPLVQGYVKPLYLNKLYQERRAIGRGHFPFDMNPGVDYAYPKGLCPVAERMYEKEFLIVPLIREAVTESDLDDVVSAIGKVLDGKDVLRDAAMNGRLNPV